MPSAKMVLCTEMSRRSFANFDPDQAQIWGADFDQMMEAVSFLEGELSEDERRRSCRFHFDNHRRQFIVGRGLLRLMLGRYLGQNPSQILFSYNSCGKPSLAESMLSFNLSHSGNRLLFGFAAGMSIGVDIERVRAESYDHSIAQQHFTPREAEILKLHPDCAVENFFTLWTCKEAVLKGTGRGIACHLQEIELSSMVEERQSACRVADLGTHEEFWMVTKLNHISGYASAVAINGVGKRLVYREITLDTLGCLF